MAFSNSTHWTNHQHGVATVGATSAALTANAGIKAVMFRADAGNSGTVTVQKAGTAVLLTGWELSAGETTPWLATSNMNEWAAIASGAGQKLRWLTAS